MFNRTPGLTRLVSAIVCIWVFVFPLMASAAVNNSQLYMFNVANNEDTLRLVNQNTGASKVLFSTFPMSFRAFATRTSDNLIYASARPQPDTSANLIVSVDPLTGDINNLLSLTESDFGLPPSNYINIEAMAISPLQPEIAVISVLNHNDNYGLLRINLDTQSIISEPIPTEHEWASMTFTPDGKKLLGATAFGDGTSAGDGSKLYEINPFTGESLLIGDTGSIELTGLAFHPETFELYAIDAFRTDKLVILNPVTGAQVRVIGSLGIAGPESLAFLPAAIPEPTSLAVLSIAAMPLLLRTRRLTNNLYASQKILVRVRRLLGCALGGCEA